MFINSNSITLTQHNSSTVYNNETISKFQFKL